MIDAARRSGAYDMASLAEASGVRISRIPVAEPAPLFEFESAVAVA